VYVHDECYQAFTAHRYALSDREAWNPFATRARAAAIDPTDMSPTTAYEWTHPPTAKLIMSLFVRLFGFRPFAYRLGSLIFGLFALLATWRLGAQLGGERFGVLALVLLASDGMLFVLSRVAMNDVYVTAMIVLAMWAAHTWWTRGRPGWLAAAGVAFGIGLTMKWSAAPLALGVGLIVAYRLGVLAWRGELRGRALALTLACFAAGWVIAPPLLYLASYLPYFALGYRWVDFTTLNRLIIIYHRSFVASHPMASRWWEWPLLTRPVWMFDRETSFEVRRIYAMGNPALWWAFLFALTWVGVRWVRGRDPGDGLILCGFLGCWLPWAFVERATYLQYLLPAVPFGVLAIARGLDDLTAWCKHARWLPAAYVTLCLCLFVNFYPLWSGYPMAPDSASAGRFYWFARWRER
jgi:dolichyl-phosphate-mannose-protein mannosyltransferase